LKKNEFKPGTLVTPNFFGVVDVWDRSFQTISVDNWDRHKLTQLHKGQLGLVICTCLDQGEIGSNNKSYVMILVDRYVGFSLKATLKAVNLSKNS
jgi:hypothetical protein